MFSKEKIIIGIHGLGNKPPAETLEDWWKSAIIEGLNVFTSFDKDLKFEMVYWADIMHPQPLDISIDDEENPFHCENPYIPAFDYTVKQPSKTRQKFLDYLVKAMDDLFLNEDFSINFSNITDKIIKKYFNDLDAYYHSLPLERSKTGEDVRHELRKRLSDTLYKHRRKDILLISHSMGTIIAYDVLSQHQDQYAINTLVTMGSPLGIPVVMSKIAFELSKKRNKTEKLKTPENIIRNWFNLSDLEDKIAVNYNLNDDYLPNSRGINAVDYIVYNNYTNGKKHNPHASYGYLRTPEMAKIIERFMLYKPVSIGVWIKEQLNRIRQIFKNLI